MKKAYIVANFKSHKSRLEMETWMETFELLIRQNSIPEHITVVLTPPMPSLMYVANRLLDLSHNIALGVQDISPFSEGAYTGAVSTKNLEGFNLQYAIIGHSERRNYFHEDDDMLAQKVIQAQSTNIQSIFCIQGEETAIPEGVSLVAYEPIFAIGSGHADTPEDANAVAMHTKANSSVESVLYGGSVTAGNVTSFISMEHINGVLVGGASLNAHTFVEIIKKL